MPEEPIELVNNNGEEFLVMNEYLNQKLVPTHLRSFNIKESQWFADLHGIRDDVVTSLSLTTYCLESEAKREVTQFAPFVPVAEAAISAAFFHALICYRRTLTTGVRKVIPLSSIDDLGPEPKNMHARLFLLANQFVAHAVNNQEYAAVQVVFRVEDSVVLWSKIQATLSKLKHPSRELIEGLKKLAENLLNRIDEEIDFERARLSGYAASMTVEQLVSLPPVEHELPESDLNKKAKRFE